MAWVEEETLGKMYVYCSKNAVDDNLALANFGRAIAWVTASNYVVGDRRTTSSIQYKCIQNATGRTTAMASDTSYWEFDKENFQTYSTTQIYNIGDKTNYANEHYVCNVNGSTGTFQPSNWTKVVVSNKLVPFRLMNTAIVMINADARFVSYESLDTILNKTYHNIHLLISNGIWNENPTFPSKYIKLIGQSKWKTKITNFPAGTQSFICSTILFKSVNISVINTQYNVYVKFDNCILSDLNFIGYTSGTIAFCYKSYINQIYGITQNVPIYHLVNSVIGSIGGSSYVVSTSIIKNNIIQSSTLPSLIPMNPNNCDYNSFSTPTILNTLKASYPLQNVNSITGVTTNSDYTLPVGSPLINAGSNGNHIGAEGIGTTQTTSDVWSTTGSTYRNIIKYGTTLIRDQISKVPQTATTNTITLSTSASTVSEEYTNFRIYISTGVGSGQTNVISAYDGSTKIATVASGWTITPDTSSVYEILDGEVTSAVGDFGSSKILKKWNFNTINYFDSLTSTIITQNVSSDDCRNINSELNFDLIGGFQSDLSDGVWRRFKQDTDFLIDSSNRGNGDASFDKDNIISNTIPMRYYQLKIQLHK